MARMYLHTVIYITQVLEGLMCNPGAAVLRVNVWLEWQNIDMHVHEDS
jgi:hypothetical protein